MQLEIDRSVHDAMLDAARRAAPLEACGLLGGCAGRATAFYEVPNADASAEHYSMKPEHQFAAVKAMRREGLAMAAIWHSHPATPPRMSEEDRRLAYTPGVVYVIVSLADAARPVTRGFDIQDGLPSEVAVTVRDGTRSEQHGRAP